MVKIKIYRDSSSGSYKRIVFDGHAGFADKGKDIVCAAVSALVINMINSIEYFTDDEIEVEADKDGGKIDCRFDGYSESAGLLIESALLGLRGIEKDYKGKYIKISEIDS